MASKSPQRRYLMRMVPISVAYVAAIFLASAIIPDNAAATPLTVTVALVPGLAVIGYIWAFAAYLMDLSDEYVRMLEVRKTLIATGLTLSLASAWGILELFTDVTKVPIFWAFPVWCLGLGVGALVNKLTLGDAGGCA